MENTSGDASYINRNNEIHNRSIHNVLGADLLDSNHHPNKWWCKADTSEEVHIWKLYSVLENTSPNFAWYCQNTITHELKNLLCDIYPIR